MSFQSNFDTSQDAAFQQRLAIALIRVAHTVTSEAPETKNYANRKNLAKLVANNASGYAVIFAVAIMGNLTLAAKDAKTIEDSELEFAVKEWWDTVAGV